MQPVQYVAKRDGQTPEVKQRSNFVLLKFKALLNGDLRNLIDRARSKGCFISLQTKLYLTKKFYEACDYLWSELGIVHNDLKVDNILISDCNTRL